MLLDLTHWLMNNTMETSDIQLYIVNAFDAQVTYLCNQT